MTNFSLIITAGGTSSRYGNKNKLLELIDDKTVIEPVGRHWMGDIIDAEGFFEGEPNKFDYYSKDIDIFEYGYEWDGNFVFATEEEALAWLKEWANEE